MSVLRGAVGGAEEGAVGLMAAAVCSACGRPLKTGFMAGGKMVTVPSCKSPVCKRFGKPS